VMKNVFALQRDNARKKAFIASALSCPVADMVLAHTDMKNICDKVFGVYEEGSIQRLSLFILEFLKLLHDTVVYIAVIFLK